jgi:hypothetical protein
MRLELSTVIALLGISVAACGGNGDQGTTTGSSGLSRLDCGNSKAGSEGAMRQFAAIVRGGDEQKILSVLAKPGRFEWISVQDARGPDLSVRNDRVRAAEAVAQRGGLPIKISRFGNSEPPRRTTDLGFRGVWDGTRPFNGKAALDCRVGKARVLSIGIPP